MSSWIRDFFVRGPVVRYAQKGGVRNIVGGVTLSDKIETPAFVTDEKTLRSDLTLLRKIADQASCKLLYSGKACSLSTVLRSVARRVDGFSCSSPFELRLVDQLCGGAASLHLVSPLIKRETLEAFGGRLDYVTFNSLSQWRRLRGGVSTKTRVGLRVNPRMSFVRDARYDPYGTLAACHGHDTVIHI